MKVAVPKRAELAKRRKKSLSIYNDNSFESTEKSKYLAYKYDFDFGCLPECKREEFEKLRCKYEK